MSLEMRLSLFTLIVIGAIAGKGMLSGSEATSRPIQEMTATEKMQIAFAGDHTADEVQRKMERLLASFDMAPSNSNLEHNASILVRMRKDTGVPELRIADCMLGLRQPGFNWQFPAAAAYCATGLSFQRR